MIMQAAAAGAGPARTPPPRLTPELAAQGIVLRPRQESDADFLRDVYVAHRWPEIVATGWPTQTCLAFLHDQYRLQDLHYREHYEGAAWCVVEVSGERAGRLYLLLQDRDLRILDISFMPAYRNRGIGGGLVQAILDQAASLGAAKVSMHVDQLNPARRLYERLGFRLIEERGPYLLLEWPLGPQPNIAS